MRELFRRVPESGIQEIIRIEGLKCLIKLKGVPIAKSIKNVIPSSFAVLELGKTFKNDIQDHSLLMNKDGFIMISQDFHRILQDPIGQTTRVLQGVGLCRGGNRYVLGCGGPFIKKNFQMFKFL